MKLGRIIGVAVAAVTLAVGSVVAGPQTASAAEHSPMGATLCNGASECGISVPLQATQNGLREGGALPVNVVGRKDVTIDVRAFALRWTSSTAYVLTPISNVVKAKPVGPASTGYGQVRVNLTIGNIPAPFNGQQVVVQPADMTPSHGMVVENSRVANEVAEYEVLSSRGRDQGFAETEGFKNGIFHRKVDLAMPGDRYSVQMLRGGKWVTIDNPNASPAIVGAYGTTSIQAKVPVDLPTGKYRTRIVNVTKGVADLSPDQPYTYFTWEAFDVYTTPGTWDHNGRKWRTSCEDYSVTVRCRTEIWATQVQYTGGRFVQSNGWVFNNLTYKPIARSVYRDNPIGGYGQVNYEGTWNSDGRKWRVECDTPNSGRGGCRSYLSATVIEAYKTSSGATAYRQVTKEVFNNIVRFTS